MSIISANTLFHFTKTKDALLSILGTGFRPSYSKEFGSAISNAITECSIPMVCFCDLPLSSLDKHIGGHKWDYDGEEFIFEGYGNYGFGMSKEWGAKRKLNPVTYITETSYYVEEFFKAYSHLTEVLAFLDDEAPRFLKEAVGPGAEDLNEARRLFWAQRTYTYNALEAIQSSMNYMKPYIHAKNRRRYYDEREWRLVVPYVSELGHEVPVLISAHFTADELEKRKAQYKTIIEKFFMLSFDSNDIKYIIVKDDSDIDDILKRMRALPAKFSEQEINRLVTRILTCEQIHEDF